MRTALACLLVLLGACAETQVLPFEKMTEEELMAYNQTLDAWDQVYCFREVRIGSRIPKNYCSTLWDLHMAPATSIGLLNVVNAGPVSLVVDY